MKVFHRSFGGPTQVCFETDSHRILYMTNVYNPRSCNHESVTIEIEQDEWQQLMKYGREAGFNDE